MTADDLSAPLGQQPRKRRFKSPVSISHVIAGALLLFLGVFAAWAIIDRVVSSRLNVIPEVVPAPAPPVVVINTT